MVTIKEIYKSVSDLIYNATNITVEDSDIEEPVNRPVFKVFMDTAKTGLYNSAIKSIKVYFDVYYFAKNAKRSTAEIYGIENTLSDAFLAPLEIKDNCAVIIDDVEFEKVENGILNCGFNFEIGTEFIDESDLEFMEELEFMEKMEE